MYNKEKITNFLSLDLKDRINEILKNMDDRFVLVYMTVDTMYYMDYNTNKVLMFNADGALEQDGDVAKEELIKEIDFFNKNLDYIETLFVDKKLINKIKTLEK